MAKATASATTPARPTKTLTYNGTALLSASYQGDGDKRDKAEMYGGYYGTNQGRQKSLVMFDFPANIRQANGCIQVTKVEISLFTRHHYYSSGGRVRFAPHRNHYDPSGFPATWPGSGPTFGEWSSDRGKFVGGATTRETSWLNITNLVPSGWGHTMATEIHSQGCWGIAIVAPNDTWTYYGYWDGAGQEHAPKIRCEYTVYA